MEMTGTATKRRGSGQPRRSSDERRDDVIRAGIGEFATHGYHAASTKAIAERAGISQPYIYALFPDKRELFLGCQRAVVERIRRRFLEAARGAEDPDSALEQMGQAYVELLEDRDWLLCQLQGYVAGADPEIREAVREDFIRLFDDVRRATGAPREEVVRFFAHGMLLNVAASLDLPRELCRIELD
jgi:AcrR family transcriptional regulator